MFLEKNKKVFDTELQAITESLKIIRKITLNNNNISITIFSDLQKTLIAICHIMSYLETSQLINNHYYFKCKEMFSMNK